MLQQTRARSRGMQASACEGRHTMSFKDRLKDAAAQAAVQARKAAEQARELAAEVKEQAEEMWAEEQSRRQGPPVPSVTPENLSPDELSTTKDGAAATAASDTDVAQPTTSTTPAAQPTTAPTGLSEGRKAPAARAPLTHEPAAHVTLGDSSGRLNSAVKREVPKPKGVTRQQIMVIGGLVGALVMVLAVIGIASLFSGESDPAPAAASAKPSPSKSVEPTPPTPAPAAPVTDISVDALLDKLNNEPIDGPGPSDPKTGDRFRISGPLIEERLWGEGASGDYSVLFKAKGGKQSLMVFVDEADAEKWTDGTTVEMVVELVEATIDGEKSNGWLRAVSTKTLSHVTTAEEKAAGSKEKMLKDADSVRRVFNKLAQFEAFLRVEPGRADGVVYVYLDPSFLAQDVDLAQQFVNQFNKALVESLSNNAAFHNMVKYFIGDQLVGENKEIFDPYSVDFKGGLEK